MVKTLPVLTPPLFKVHLFANPKLYIAIFFDPIFTYKMLDLEWTSYQTPWLCQVVLYKYGRNLLINSVRNFFLSCFYDATKPKLEDITQKIIT